MQEHLWVVRGGDIDIAAQIIFEFDIAHVSSLEEVPFLDSGGDALGELNGLHHRRAHDLVLAHSNDIRRSLRG